MSSLIVFAALNAAFRMAVAGILIYKLTFYRDTFNQWERAGLSVGAGTSLLTIPVIFDIQKIGTPMDGWAGALFTFAMLLYFIGRVKRLHAHEARNDEMRAQARRHFDDKEIYP